MSQSTAVFECVAASRRVADAQSVAELEKEWVTVRDRFQAAWVNAGHKLIVLVHDEKGEVADADVTQVLETVNTLDKKIPIDVILHTHGGLVGPTMQIAEVLAKRRKTRTYVPFFAHSGGTLIALSTEKIFMGKGAALGPIDVQFAGRPAHDIIRIVEELGNDASAEWRSLAKNAKRVLKDWSSDVCKLINKSHKGWFGRRGCALAVTLTSGEMYHGRSINFSEAKKLHINVSDDFAKSVFALLNVRLEQLRRLRELEAQINLVEKHADAPGKP